MVRFDKKLVLIGGGGHCKSVLDVVLSSREYEDIVIVDPKLPIGSKIYGCNVVGDDNCLHFLRLQGYQYAFVTVGSITSTTLRQKLVDKIVDLGFEIPIIIDSTAIISMGVEIGIGTFVGKGVTINTDVSIGKHCIINTGSVIEHECRVDDFTHISVGAILCGNVHVGLGSLIGAGTVVIQGITVGSNTMVGAGAVVNRDLSSDCTAVGIPARVIKKKGT